MCNPQTAVVKETQRKHFHNTSQLKRFSIIENIVMAFEYLFGCWHRKMGRPFTLSGWTYEVCLNCGRKFAYNRAEIGCGVLKQQEVGRNGTSWHETHARVSLLAELQ